MGQTVSGSEAVGTTVEFVLIVVALVALVALIRFAWRRHGTRARAARARSGGRV